MRISNFTTQRPTMSETRTYEDFSKFLGAKPERLGLVARLYPHLTASYLTDALRNVFYADTNKSPKYLSINSFMFEWNIEVNQIKRIELADVPCQTYAGGEITMAFKERYYEMNDIFRNDVTEEQFFVVSGPIRKADNYWEVLVRPVDTVIEDSVLTFDGPGWQIGDTTRFIGNAFPELSEYGFVKYQSSTEKMRNYITTHRVQDSYSDKYAAMEDMFIKVGEGKDGKETIYRMDKMKKNLLENFLTVRNNMLLFSKSTVDANGKTSLVDKATGRPIYIGDGLIPQVERYADKFVYNKLSIDFFHTIINAMIAKADYPTGNKWVFIVNEKLWAEVNNTLAKYLADFKTDATYMWSKDAGKYLKVGATFDTYEYLGNLISFKPDRTFSREMGYDKGYGVCLDLTADLTNGQPPIALYTVKGGDLIQNSIVGVGGRDGVSSGEVSTPVAGGAEVIMGYSGIMVANPYKSVIIRGI